MLFRSEQGRFAAADLDAWQRPRFYTEQLVHHGCPKNEYYEYKASAQKLSDLGCLMENMGCKGTQVLPFSTGVIMEQLPADKLIAGLAALKDADWLEAAEAIMTTDTVPKAVSRRVRLSGGDATVTGIAKGAGMIRPDMATMLAFVATDAKVARSDLQRLTKQAAERSFNAITIDGDTSTNDAFVCLATGQGPVARSEKDLASLAAGVTEVAQQLAQAIIRDGEGATKFVTVRVERGRSVAECRKVAYAIAHSPLVKTRSEERRVGKECRL